MNSLSMLTECLIPFIAKRVDSQLLWNNVIDSDLLEELKKETSYLIERKQQHSVFDTRIPLLSNEKVFYAERYGGSAISYNGGGARCGFDGRWQIKGIGANALVGQGSRQVDGELTLTGAVLEVIWGVVMAKVLPYGAVPNRAILLTENLLADSISSASSMAHARRTLLVREPVVRPAHFCRAPYYRPHAAMLSQQTDSERVEKQIAVAPLMLPRPLPFDENQWIALASDERALYGLCELAQRLAAQIACCRSRHLVMMTSPSNCDIKGRLLDFHGMRSVFPVERQDAAHSYFQYNKLNEDVPLLLQGVQDVGFFLAKYQFGSEFLNTARQAINVSFFTTYKKTCLFENLAIAGFDKEFLQCLTITDELVAMGDRLQNILDLSAGFFTQSQGLGKGHAHPAIALLHQMIDACAYAVSTTDVITAEGQFSQTFYRLCRNYLHKSSSQGKTTDELQKTMKDIITRRLAPRAFMKREAIYQEIKSWSGGAEDIAEQLQTYLTYFERQSINILQ